MRSREIPRGEWRTFFTTLSRLHDGAFVSIRIGAGEVNSRQEVAHQPLRGFSDDGDEIMLMVGKPPHGYHLGHRIQHVYRVRLEQTDEGADAAVDIADNRGTSTIVRFESPMLPELLDPGVE